MDRRRWLQFVAALAAWLRSHAAGAALVDQLATAPRELSALGPFLDTLIPADTTPSATQLGIHTRLLASAAAGADAELLATGCGWLDAQARFLGKSGFAALGETEREAIVARAAAAPPGALPNVFFQRVRSDSMRHYYSMPASWAGLGFDGPPQPRGFPGHDRPPPRR